MKKIRIQFFRQKDSMQCGVACLAMICSMFGKKTTLTKISQKCHTSINGVSLKGISDAASELGLSCIPVKTTIENIIKYESCAILHWNQNHFVVLYHIDKDGKRFWIADPGKGKYKLSINDLKVHWSDESGQGIAMFFEPNDHFEKDDVIGQEKKSFNFLWKYALGYKQHFFQVILGLFIGCCLQLLMPFLTQWIVDIGIKHNDIGFIWLVLLGELMIIVGKTATDFVRRWLLMHISMRINISLVSDFFIKLLKLPMSFFDTKLLGDMLQRINDHGRIQIFLTNQVLGMIFSLLSFLVFGIVLYVYNIIIFVIFIAGSVIYGLWIAKFLSRRKIIDYELFEQQAINQDKTYQFLTSIQEIKLQNCEKRRRWEWEDTQADLFEIQMKSMKLQQTQEAGSIFINEIKNIFITVFAATSVINGHLSLGAMLAIQYIVGQLNSPVEQLMQFIYSLQDVKLSLERINEIHGFEEEKNSCRELNSFTSDKSIQFSHVDFKYDLHAIKKVLNNISIVIPEGRVTAIVGASGSGKTTLIKLMLGYYPVQYGKILISGNDIGIYDLKWLRCQCGVVMQDGVIFSESIARNIAVDDDEIDWVRLEKAVRIANIYDYIINLPLKFNTKIGQDGIGLSQGQKQRILIARAVYKDPDFIFLDEATNALDAKNEKIIVENLNEFYKGRTVVVVAHRLSTVKNADQIIVLDGGEVVEIGNHTSLIEKKGSYYNLVKNQLELGN